MNVDTESSKTNKRSRSDEEQAQVSETLTAAAAAEISLQQEKNPGISMNKKMKVTLAIATDIVVEVDEAQSAVSPTLLETPTGKQVDKHFEELLSQGPRTGNSPGARPKLRSPPGLRLALQQGEGEGADGSLTFDSPAKLLTPTSSQVDDRFEELLSDPSAAHPKVSPKLTPPMPGMSLMVPEEAEPEEPTLLQTPTNAQVDSIFATALAADRQVDRRPPKRSLSVEILPPEGKVGDEGSLGSFSFPSPPSAALPTPTPADVHRTFETLLAEQHQTKQTQPTQQLGAGAATAEGSEQPPCEGEGEGKEGGADAGEGLKGPQEIEGGQAGGTLCLWPLPPKWKYNNVEAMLDKHNLTYQRVRKKFRQKLAFVTFSYPRDREAAEAALNGKALGEGGRILEVTMKLGKGDPKPPEGEDKKKHLQDGSGEGKMAANVPKDIRDAVTPLWKLPYCEQLRQKQQETEQVMKRITKYIKKELRTVHKGQVQLSWIKEANVNRRLCCHMEGIMCSPVLEGYRNKVEFTCGPNLEGTATVGFLQGTFMQGHTAVAEPTHCLNVSPSAIRLAAAMQRFLREGSRLPVWDKRANKGVWRQLFVREGGASPVPSAWQDFTRDVTGGAGKWRTSGEAAAQRKVEDHGQEEGKEEGDEDKEEAAAEVDMKQLEAAVSDVGWMSMVPPTTVMAVIQLDPLGSGLEGEEGLEAVRRECVLLREALLAECSGGAEGDRIPLDSILMQLHSGVSNAAPATATILPLGATPTQETGTTTTEEKMEVSEGPESPSEIYEKMCGLTFRVSPTSFFQVNTCAASLLYSLAGQWADVGRGTVLLDVCCGTGTIGLTLASSVAKVVGIDIVADAIEDAKQNAALNDIKNVEFVCGRAEDVLPDLLARYANAVDPTAEGRDSSTSESEKFSNVVAIVDPPRPGLHKKVLNALRRTHQLKRLIYVSCNQTTLAENAVQLCLPLSSGQYSDSNPPPFVPVKSMAIDLFPHTSHCETIMMFER